MAVMVMASVVTGHIYHPAGVVTVALSMLVRQ